MFEQRVLLQSLPSSLIGKKWSLALPVLQRVFWNGFLVLKTDKSTSCRPMSYVRNDVDVGPAMKQQCSIALSIII